MYGLFASEYDYRMVIPKTRPLGEFALQFARGRTKNLLHSHGAIRSLEKLLPLIHKRGFILINDYGLNMTTSEGDFEHQRFGFSTFVGVNFPQLGAYFQDKPVQWLKPDIDLGGFHSRLLSAEPDCATTLMFRERFGLAAAQHLQEPTEKARQWLQVGRFELAAADYRDAIERQPYNWVLLNEVAMFLIFSLRDIKARIDMSKLALAQNPNCSAELWNTLGDGLFEFGRYDEARSAYFKAMRVNEADVRCRFNLAWVYLREHDYPAALAVIAEAFALDKTGQYRDRLLQKQQEVLALMANRHQQEYLRLSNLVSRHSGDNDKPKPSSPDRIIESPPRSTNG